jgi:hypothetical protein
MRQIEEEYYKTDDPNADPKKDLYPLSLNQSLTSLGMTPDPVKTAMKSILINTDANTMKQNPTATTATAPMINEVVESPSAAPTALTSLFENSKL